MPEGVTRLPHAHVADVVNLPNIITFARLCAVPLAVWLVVRRRLDLAFAVFVCAGVSDAVDGFLARRRGGTAVGALLDPIADKALLVSMFVTLAAIHVLPDWLAILVVFRDVVIVGGIVLLWGIGHPVAIRPLLVSKVNTAAQIVMVGTALLLTGFQFAAPWMLATLVWCTAASTLVSGFAYVRNVATGR